MQDTRREPPIQFRDQRIAERLDARGANRNEIARRDLDRYYDLLEREARRLSLADDELDAIVRVLSSVTFADTSAPYLIASEVEDAIDELTVLLGARAQTLIDRLNGLSLSGKLALTDLVERQQREASS